MLLVAATIMVYSQRKHVQILLGNMVRFGHVANIIVWFVNRHEQARLQWLSRLNDYVFKEHMFWKVLCSIPRHSGRDCESSRHRKNFG